MKKFLLLLLLSILVICFNIFYKSNSKEHRSCFEVEVMRNNKLVTIDSCFVAPTADSLEALVTAFKQKRDAAKELYDTRLYFVIIDTLNKQPNEYEYGIVVSEAGIINPEVILTNDQEYVKNKINSYIKENIIYKKLNTGETMQATVETIFKTNIRINYRREGTTKVRN